MWSEYSQNKGKIDVLPSDPKASGGRLSLLCFDYVPPRGYERCFIGGDRGSEDPLWLRDDG